MSRMFTPNVDVDEITIPHGNEQVYVAGRARWGAGAISIRDYIDRDLQAVCATWFSQVYGGVLDPTDGSIGQPKRYKKEADIVMFAPDGTSERSWHLIGLWPQSWAPGDLSQDSSDQVVINMNLRYDKAFYKGNSGI